MKSHSIKKLLSVVLMLTMVLSCIPFTALAEEEAETALPESELQNLYLLLNDPEETELKVAYLGGSVTVGSGSSNISTKSWRALVGQWFVDTYGPESSYGKNVTNVHAAIGATGSYFGSYRVWQDCQLGSDNPPDVLFIEFAINDIYDVTSSTQTEINYESIIRQAYKANPKITIIPVFTMDNNIAYNYINKGHDDNKYFTIQRTIAEHYGLPQVNVGHALIDVINGVYQAEGKTFKASDSSDANSIWRRYITDSCHPGDAGYAVYADTVIAYITEQLGNTVAHNEEVKSVDLAATPSYASTKGNEAHLKENGRYISFKDAGFTGSELHGWTLATTSAESRLEYSNGIISTNLNNASFAFKFTGTAVGFFNHGRPDSGTIDYTITSTEDPTEKYVGSVSLVKNYNGGLPFPGELKTGLPNKEWLVECVLRNAGNGAYGQLKYIYIDGDTSSISPAPAPKTMLPPITVGASAYTEVYGGSIGELTTYEGLSAKKVTGNTSSTEKPQVDNFRYNTLSTKITFPSYKYVGVTYYYVSGGSNVPQNITMQLDQLIYGGSPTGWLPGTTNFPMSIAQKTAPLVGGKWVTQYFDFSEFSEAADTIYPGAYLYQGRHYPFGIISGNTMKGTEESWFNGITFRTDAPKFYSADGEKIDYNDGSAIVYVSSEGSVTVGEKTFEAYTTIVDAINALSPVGGFIRVSGNASFVDGSINRNKITIEAADETAKLTNINLNITKGDLELRNISMAGHDDENWTKTNGYTLILGEGFTVDKYVRPGMNGSGKPTNVTMYSGKLKDFGAAANYGGTFTVTGDSHFNIYGGTVVNISGFSRNGISTSGHHTVNGDVIYNIYGGSISGTLASTVTTGTLNGNLWYNIYGGTFASGTTFGFGDRQGFGTNISVTETRNASIHGNQIFLINNKQIVENAGSLAGVTIGKKLVNGIYNADAGLFVIVNNAELSETTGAAISESSYADWNLLVSYGQALPVFDENRALLGFKITSDIENGVVYLDDEVILPDENGLYQIEESAGVIRNIVIKEPGPVDVIFTDGTNTQTVEGKQYNPTTLPACTFTKDGYVFSGWKIEGDDTVYVPNQSYTLGVTSATFTAQWTLRTDITTVYVDPNAESGGTGLSANSPVSTFKQAQAIINDTTKDFTIVLSGEYKMTGYNKYFNNHTGAITLDGNGEGILSWDSQMYGCGPIGFKNIKFRVLASNNFLEANAKDIVFGEGISNLPTVDGGSTTYLPLMHVGAQNTTTPYQNVSFSSGDVNLMYVGAFYNTDANNADETKGARIFVNGGKINNIIFAPDGYTGHNGPAKWTNAASVVIDGGTVAKVSTRAGSTYEYPTQVVVNNGLAIPTIEDGGNAGTIIVTSTEGGRVDVTATPGEFSITTDSETLYINGVLTEKSENGIYTFNTAGTYAVAYELSEVNFIAGTSDVTGTAPTMAAVAKGSTITLPENTFVRDGFEFVSWYDGENFFNAGASYAVVGDEANFTPLWRAADGTRAYLSSDDGYADTNGDGIIDVVAHTTFANAINSITAATGGTIYLEGTYSGAFSETSNDSRGPVTVRGITNDTANKFSLDTYSNYVFSKGDISFDYMTIKAPNDEFFLGISGGYTMTFGENLAVEARGTRYLYVGSPTTANGVSNYVINGGSFSYIMSGGNYNSSSTHNGDVYYTTNGGTIREYYGGSRNSSGANKYTTNGNVYHTINGGTFTQNAFLGSHRADKVLGNVVFTVNGGTFGGFAIIAGHNAGSSDTSLIAGVNNVVIVNNAAAPEGHNFNLKLGRSGAGKNVSGNEIYIINNCEIDAGVAINTASTAAYKIRVNGGSATPVFADGVGGALLGFDIVSDVEGAIPAVGGNALTKNENGYYDLTADTTADSYIDISFLNLTTPVEFVPGTADTQGTATSTKVAENTEITLPANTFTREGYEFVDWFDGTNRYAAGASYTVTESVTFTPVWKNTLTTRVYLSTDGVVDTNADGRIDVANAQTTFLNAMNSVTTAGATIYVEGTVQLSQSGTNDSTNARGAVSIVGIAGSSSAKLDFGTNWSNYPFRKGDISFDNITIKGSSSELYLGVSNGYTLTIGENVAVEANGGKNLLVGILNGEGGSKYVLNGGIYSQLFASGAYLADTGAGKVLNGDVYYTFNGGTYSQIYGGSRNSNAANPANVGNGNRYYTFNDGNFKGDIFLGSHSGDKVAGNIIFTVNGGNFNGVTMRQGHSRTYKTHIAGVHSVIIVNNANAPEGHKFNLKVGSADYINYTDGGTIIINNAEIDTGVTVPEYSQALYELFVYEGTANPVFADGVGGDLLGFDIVSDKAGYVPVVNGKLLSKNANGYYDLTAYQWPYPCTKIEFVPAYVMIGETIVTMNSDNTVTAVAGVVDFESSVAPKLPGKLFIGWYDADGNAVANGTALAAGDVLTARFVDFVTDETAAGYNFGIEGAQVRLNGEAALRFVTDFDKTLRNTLIELDENLVPADAGSQDVGYGFVVLPTNILGDAELTKETPRVAVIPAVKLYTDKDEESFVRYTACLTGITEDKYAREYAAVSYITYTDANGIVHTVYGEMYATSMVNIAQATLDNRVEEGLTEDQILALEAIVGTNN